MKQAIKIVKGVKYKEHWALLESRMIILTMSNINLLHSRSFFLKSPA